MITRNCLTCQKEFTAYAENRKYCSGPCVPKNLGNSARWKDKVHATLICAVCGKEFTVPPSRANKAKYCNYACHQIGEGRKAGKVRGEQVKAARKTKSYPKLQGRHAHRVVAEKMLGRPLLPEEVVHHKDENPLNYAEENLMVFPNQAAHAAHHQQLLREKEAA